MKKFVITALVLGLSSAAFAAPGDGYHDTTKPNFAPPSAQLGDHDRDNFRRPMPMLEWTTLSTSQRLSGTESIRVRSRQAFSKLEIQAQSGMTKIDRVVIKFDNGRSQVVECDQAVSLRNPMVIDLDGQLRKIKKVTVYGKSGRRSAISVLAV